MKLQIVLLNPNTNAGLTAGMLRAAEARLAGRAAIMAQTAPFGSEAIRNPADMLVAEQAVAQMIAGLPPVAAVIVAAFGDPGLAQARDLWPRRRIFGIGDSSLRAAAQRGPFAMLTLGPAHELAIRARLGQMGMAAALTSLRFLGADIPAVAANPARFVPQIIATAAEAAAEGAQSLLLGGAPFSGLGRQITAAVPVLDGLSCALDELLDATPDRPGAPRLRPLEGDGSRGLLR